MGDVDGRALVVIGLTQQDAQGAAIERREQDRGRSITIMSVEMAAQYYGLHGMTPNTHEILVTPRAWRHRNANLLVAELEAVKAKASA